jgi:hypothetical protein
MPSPHPPRWRALRLPKHGHTADEYEDACAVDPAARRFAVADGASESAFAGLWARLLVEGLVAARRPRVLPSWLDGARRHWSAEVMGLELPWYAEMKRQEGAFAALLGVGVRPPTAKRAGRWRAVAVGDSCLFRVRKGRDVRAFPVKQSSDFGNEPRLIGSWPGGALEPSYAAGSLLPGDRLFLMTDALAQWFLHDHERGGRPWEAIAPLLSADRPEEDFAARVEELRGRDGLRDDDVTLLIIATGSAPEERPA